MVDLISTALTFFVVAVTPGPATISNAAIAMSYGRKPSLIYGAGLSCGLVLWGLVAATGMGAVLQSSLYLLMTLKVLGGLYLLWLAFQSGRSAFKTGTDTPVIQNDKRWFLRGLILNMSNPKSVMAWMAALSIGLGANANISSVIAATLVCIAVGFFVNGLYSVVFSINGMMVLYKRSRRRVDAFVATLFAFAGLSLIRSAMTD